MKRLGLVLCLLAGSLSATNGFRPIGYGTKTKGMGGAGVALPQDAFAVALNPAGIGFVCDRFDVGLQYLRHKVDADLRNTLPSSVSPQVLHSSQDLWWPEIAVTWNYCPCVVLGLAAYAWGGWKIDYNKKTRFGEGTDLGADYQVYFVTPSWAMQCGRHTLGVSANIATAALDLSGLESFETEAFSAFPDYISNKGTDYKHGLGLHFGWIGQFDCGLTLGLAYKTKTWMNHFKKYRGFIATDGNWDLPSVWSLGITWCITRFIVLSVDIERIMWTDTPIFRQDIFSEKRFGSKASPGFGWEDQTAAKLGVAWDVSNQFTLRAGFNYGTTLYASRDLVLNVLTQEMIKHHFTVGLTYYNGCHEFSFDYIAGERHVLVGALPGADNVPTNNLPQAVANTRAQNRSSQDSWGLAYGYRF